MARRIGRKLRRAYHRRPKIRHHRDRRLPLSAGIGLATSILAPSRSGFASSVDSMKNGDWAGAIDGFVDNWTGLGSVMKPSVGIQFDMWKTLNPLDFSRAPALKTTLLTSIMFRLVKKFAKVDPIQKIPYVNKIVKFS